MLPTMELTGSSAIVTGAASGIGAAVARALAAKGAPVIIADLQADKGEEIEGALDVLGRELAQPDAPYGHHTKPAG